MLARRFVFRPLRWLGLAAALLVPACGQGGSAPGSSPFWGFTYGGSLGELAAHSPLADRTGGYGLVGTTNSFGAGKEDGWVVAISPTGHCDWAKTFGGAEYDYFQGATGASNGDLVVTGHTSSFGAGASDLWVLRLAPNGSIVWQKTFGGADQEYGASVWPTSDGGFVIGGGTQSYAAMPEPWIMKLNGAGARVWQNRYGGGEFWSLTKTPDGGFIATVNPGNEDLRLFKIDGNGAPVWESHFDLVGTEYGLSAIQTSDGGCLVVGKWAATPPNYDLWIMKLNSNGSIAWQFSLGGAEEDEASSAVELPGGGYLVAGSSFSTGDWEGMLLRLNSNGSIAEQKRYGGVGYDQFSSIRSSPDGGFFVQGTTTSYGTGVGIFTNDLWILKINASGTLPLGGIPTTYVPVATTAVRSVQATSVIATTDPGAATAVTGADSALEVHSAP